MANSDWASEAFGPLHETRADKERTEARTQAFFTEQFSVLEITDELELTDGCPTCFDWVWGRGPECEQHRRELSEIRRNGIWWNNGETA